MRIDNPARDQNQIHIGAALRCAVNRAWQAALRWVARQLPRRPVLHLPRHALLPAPVRVYRAGARRAP